MYLCVLRTTAQPVTASLAELAPPTKCMCIADLSELTSPAFMDVILQGTNVLEFELPTTCAAKKEVQPMSALLHPCRGI